MKEKLWMDENLQKFRQIMVDKIHELDQVLLSTVAFYCIKDIQKLLNQFDEIFKTPERIRFPWRYRPISRSTLPRVMRICQNCRYAINNHGHGGWFQDGWNVFCNTKGRFFRWDMRKRCFQQKNEGDEHDKTE